MGDAGAVAGSFTVKSCGNAHAWCRVCRPEQAAALRRPKPPRRADLPPCRNCGSCDHCLGLTAPAGMKVCRQCGGTKPLAAFARRWDTGKVRNQCMQCRNGGLETGRCEGCGKSFGRWSDGRKLCAQCRPKPVIACVVCGTGFTSSMEQRRYCSAPCRDAGLKDKRDAVRKAQRIQMLQAYGGPEPACACCGEREPVFLALDHIEGGGGRQRKELGGGGFITWLRRNGYPAGFRVLCHNCNFGRQINGGACPHL